MSDRDPLWRAEVDADGRKDPGLCVCGDTTYLDVETKLCRSCWRVWHFLRRIPITGTIQGADGAIVGTFTGGVRL